MSRIDSSERVTGAGLYSAWTFVLCVIALASSVAGVVAGPRDQLSVFLVFGGISALVIATTVYRRFRPVEAEQTDAAEEAIPLSRYPKLEAVWAVGVTVSVSLFILVPGPRRAGWVVIGVVCAWQFVRLEIERRRVLGRLNGGPVTIEARRPGVSAASALWAVLLVWGAFLLAISIVAVRAGDVGVAAGGFGLCVLIFGGLVRRLWQARRQQRAG